MWYTQYYTIMSATLFITVVDMGPIYTTTTRRSDLEELKKD